MSWVIFDLDSTLADTRHRRAHLPVRPIRPIDWVDYHSRCVDDAPIEGRVVLARLLAPRHHIAIITARPDTPEISDPTLAWLDTHDVPFDRIFFMPLDAVFADIWKATATENLAATVPVALVVDDSWTNGAALEPLGVPFLHVTPPGLGRF